MTNNKFIREPGNFITHVIPAVLSFIGLYLLIAKSTTPYHIIASIIYGVGMITMFAVSSLYHSIPRTEYTLRLWQKFDHCCIYIMIAGSFTPTALLIFDDWMRWFLFGLVWFVALIGCLLKIFNRLKNQLLSTGLYIGMGCMIIPFMHQILTKLPFEAIVWLILGGVFYIGGTYYYAKDKPLHRYVHSHEVWHIFVNLGAFAHFIYNYVYVFNV